MISSYDWDFALQIGKKSRQTIVCVDDVGLAFFDFIFQCGKILEITLYTFALQTKPIHITACNFQSFGLLHDKWYKTAFVI